MASFDIRRARLNERTALLECIHDAFKETEPRDFTSFLPHLFQPGRIEEHFVAAQGERIVGVVGCYPFPYRFGNATFASAGIGQVCTRPDARGHGIMRALMEAALDAHASSDFFWLWGDRQRYARYGFELAGKEFFFTTWPKYLAPWLPTQPPEPFVPSKQLDLCQRILDAEPQAVLPRDGELPLMLRGLGLTGLRLGQAALLLSADGTTVHHGLGSENDLLALLAAHARTLHQAGQGGGQLTIRTGPDLTPLHLAAQRACNKFRCAASTHVRAQHELFGPADPLWPATQPHLHIARLYGL